MAKLTVRKGDTVKVLNGKDAGKTGEIIRALPSDGKVVVKGVALVKKSVRPTQQNPRGGIVTKEAAINVSRVQLICPKCGRPTRTGSKVNEKGKKVRYCKKKGCLAEFE